MKALFYLLLIGLMYSCSTGENKAQSSEAVQAETTVDAVTLKKEIDDLEAFFKGNSNKPLNKAKATQFIDKSKQYVASFPDEEMSPAFLFRAGEVARAIKDYQASILMMDQVYNKYPDHEKAPSALFLKAFTYEENLNDTESAKKYYNEFLQRFPEHDLAKQVEQLLGVIDQSPEDLIKSFQKKNQ